MSTCSAMLLTTDQSGCNCQQTVGLPAIYKQLTEGCMLVDELP
jgi:hypothetical protein